MNSLRDTLAKLKEQKQAQISAKGGSGQTWVKKGDLEKERQQIYMNEQKQREEEKRQKQELKLKEIQQTYSSLGDSKQLSANGLNGQHNKLTRDQIMRGVQKDPTEQFNDTKSQNLIEETKNDKQEEELIIPLSKEEVMSQLRQLKQATTLYGETDKKRYLRLLDCQQQLASGLLQIDEETLKSSKTVESEVEQLNQMKQLESQMEANKQKQLGLQNQQLLTQKQQQQQKFGGQAVQVNSIDEYIGLYKTEDELKIGDRNINDLVEIKEKNNQTFRNYKKFENACKRHPPEEKCLVIYLWCKKMLKAWENELLEKSEDFLRSAEGKQEISTQKQCTRHCKPFFKQLKKKQINDEIMDGVYLIIQYTLMKEYVRAHDKYLELAIGNAPWPMGVTMVGIHERAGRSKIFSSQVAHILNDENQRKTLQAVKRLLTVCQRIFPTDPSRWPSFVGKTSIINRFINNSFSTYYEPTLHAQIYRRAFNILEDQDVDPQFVELEIIDVFPHDHPLLDKDPDYSDLAREMSITLNDIVKNNFGTDASSKIHGYMFIYDASNKFTFDTLSCLMETIKEIEKSERRGKKSMMYQPKKLVIGNKKDLKRKKQVLEKNDLKKLEGMRYREVSALTNQGIQEAFKILIGDINSCNILHKEFYDLEKMKNREQDELKEMEEYGGKNMRSKSQGGLFGMLPFGGCYGTRDDGTDEEEQQYSSQEEYDENDPKNSQRDTKGGLNQSGTKGKNNNDSESVNNEETNCNIY
eukprot:403355282